MILGRVIGEVWATRRDPRLGRSKLLVVRPHGLYEPAFGGRHLVATDDVQAGVVVDRTGAFRGLIKVDQIAGFMRDTAREAPAPSGEAATDAEIDEAAQ